MVGAGEVELAGGVGEDAAEAVAGDGVADFRGRRAVGVFELADPGFALGRGDRRLGAVGDAGDLAQSAPAAAAPSRR